MLQPAAEEPPRPKKVFVPPIKLPPPPDTTAPKPRPYGSKFKTPLMLAEERYRKQREEAEKNKGESTPTSPQPTTTFNVSEMKAEAESSTQKAEKPQINFETQKETKVPEPEQPAMLPKETAEKRPQTPPKKKPTANSQISKPSIPKVVKKTTTESSNTLSDKKQASITAALEIKSHPAPTVHPHPVQVESTKAHSGKQESIQATKSVQSQITASAQEEEIKSLETCAAQEVKKVSSQTTKIPKVTPSFKVKTFKVPKVEKPGKQDEEKDIVQSSVQTSVSEVCIGQEGLQKSNSAMEKTEVKVEKKEEMRQTKQDTKMEVQLKKQRQTSVKQPPPVAPRPSVEIHQIQPAISIDVHQGHGQTTVIQSHQAVREECVQIHEERMVTQSTVQQQSTQQKSKLQIKKQVKPSPRPPSREEAIKQSMQKEEQNKTEITETADSEKSASITTENSYAQKCEEIKKLLSYIKEFEGSPAKMNPKSLKTMLSIIPEWLVDSEEKAYLSCTQYNKQKIIEVITYVQNLALAKLNFLERNLSVSESAKSESTQEKKIVGGATQKISKITIGSAKIETQKKVLEEKKTECQSESKTAELKMPPELRMRTPSPTYICIESAKRTDSPLRVTPSPTSSYRSGTTPTPPPRWSETPTRLNQSTPSPTMIRSEKLAKLRDTTAKLSQGMTPPPMPLPEYIIKVQTDLEGSRSSSCSEITFETQMMESSLMDITDIHGDSMMTVKDKREFFEEAQKAEVSRTYVRRDPIDIPERLEPDTEDEPEIPRSTDTHERMLEDLPRVDLSRLVNKFESPQPKVYVRKEPIVITERLESDTEDAEPEKKSSLVEDIPS